jgi:hypothetical protein
MGLAASNGLADWSKGKWLRGRLTLLGTEACALMAVNATTVAANGTRKPFFFTRYSSTKELRDRLSNTLKNVKINLCLGLQCANTVSLFVLPRT